MGKDKVIEKTGQEMVNKSNIILQYSPIIIGFISLVVCYLLFKKIQSLSTQRSALDNIEKQFTNFVKEQAEINTINAKKLNALISQLNQVSYVMQNNNVRENNTINSQMSPSRENLQSTQSTQPTQATQATQASTEVPAQVPAQVLQESQQKQPPQREMMPTSVIQTNFPMNNVEGGLPAPMNTSVKKESENSANNLNVKKQQSNKKVVDIQTVKEEVLIEEASSSDDEE